jgi:raffinose synthase
VASYLGWCTWDAFYHDVSAQGIMSGLDSFRRAGVQPRWIIIDDGWQVGGVVYHFKHDCVSFFRVHAAVVY